VKYFEDRERIGYIATNIAELKEQVARALKNAERFARNSRRFRDETVFNLGKAEDYFAENFHCIAEGTKHKDWQYVVAPSSQSEARLLGSLHADIEQYIEKIDSLDKVLEEQRTAIRKTKKLANDKSIQIDDLHREVQEKNDDIAGLKVNIEQKNQAIDGLQKLVEQKEQHNRKLGDALRERDENIQNLKRELGEIRSTWWFRLFSWVKKRFTTGKKADKEKPAKETQQ
jgi:DNA repair exonuclease SbcCD ATPase subunit